jgi:hypothetical protein
MIYSQVIASGLIRPKKARYTRKDVDAAQVDTLFSPHQGRTLTRREAVFVVKCSAIFHETDYAKNLS